MLDLANSELCRVISGGGPLLRVRRLHLDVSSQNLGRRFATQRGAGPLFLGVTDD